MARVTCHVPYFLSNIFNHLRDSKSIFGPQFGQFLVHSFVDRLSSTLVPASNSFVACFRALRNPRLYKRVRFENSIISSDHKLRVARCAHMHLIF